MDKTTNFSLKIPNSNNNRENNLRRQKSINVPLTNKSYFKSPSTPIPIRSNFSGHSPLSSPRSVDYEIFKNRNSNDDQGESMHFLQVHSPTKSCLPHQYSAESTESAASCLSRTSIISQEMSPVENYIRSQSEISTASFPNQSKNEKLGLWPSFKKILMEKKRTTFKKGKAEVKETKTDPVYHLLKCGANPNHNLQVCLCDCHQKSDQQNK